MYTAANAIAEWDLDRALAMDSAHAALRRATTTSCSSPEPLLIGRAVALGFAQGTSRESAQPHRSGAVGVGQHNCGCGTAVCNRNYARPIAGDIEATLWCRYPGRKRLEPEPVNAGRDCLHGQCLPGDRRCTHQLCRRRRPWTLGHASASPLPRSRTTLNRDAQPALDWGAPTSRRFRGARPPSSSGLLGNGLPLGHRCA